MNDLQHLNLSEDDFKLIIDGLEYLPSKGAMGDMLGELVLSMMTKEGSETRERMERENRNKMQKKKAEAEVLKENIMILQAKLLTLKRVLRENGALREAREIIDTQ